jgi:hypothetical protein
MENHVVKVNEAKPKSIIIDGRLHYEFKIYCKGKSLKIGGISEELIRMYLNNTNTVQKLIDELKKNK